MDFDVFMFLLLITLAVITATFFFIKYYLWDKTKKLRTKIVDLICYKTGIIFYSLIIPIIITFWLAPVTIIEKIIVTIHLVVMYPINLLANPIICIYIILSDYGGAFGVVASIIATIVLLLNILTFLLVFIISDKKEGKKSNKLLISLSLVVMCVVIGFSVFKTSEKYTTISTISSDKKNIELVSLTDYVSPGETAHIQIKSTPNTEHEISVTYSSGTSTAEGLYNKYSNSNGYVEWSWKVGTNTSEGSYPISIYNYDTLDSETFYFTVQ